MSTLQSIRGEQRKDTSAPAENENEAHPSTLSKTATQNLLKKPAEAMVAGNLIDFLEDSWKRSAQSNNNGGTT
jgi:hypothetical protein